MALIICPECGKQFSDKAAACPNCGCPTSEIIKSRPGGGIDKEAEKQMLELVEKTLEKARKAGAAYELAADGVQKLATSTNINLFGGSARQDTSRIVEAAVTACDNLYSAYQALIPTLDGGCRPLLAKNPGAKAVKAVAGTMAWLNEESEIENNYAINFNGTNLGNAVKAKYIPSPVNRAIQGFWEAEYAKLPDHAEAESFWKEKLNKHKSAAYEEERKAKDRERQAERDYRQYLREEEQKAKQKEQEGEKARSERFLTGFDAIKERMAYIRPAAGLFSSTPVDYAYVTGEGKAVFVGTRYNQDPKIKPDDVSQMSNLCQIAINMNVIIGLQKSGRVVTAPMDRYQASNYGYGVVTSWQNVKKIAIGKYHVAALRYNGTCVGTKYKSNTVVEYYGQGDVEAWRDVVDIVCGDLFTAGLKSDGRVVVAGASNSIKNLLGAASGWTDIVLIYADGEQLYGVKRDGTLVCTDLWTVAQPDQRSLKTLSAARDIVALAAYSEGYAALQSDGNVIGVGKDWNGRDVGKVIYNGRDAVGLYTMARSLIILKENGVLEKLPGGFFVFRGSPKLFDSYADYQKAERERIQAREEAARIAREQMEAAERKKREEEALRAERRAKNLCQHCGGELEKKLFGWKCKNCGQRKDY